MGSQSITNPEGYWYQVVTGGQEASLSQIVVTYNCMYNASASWREREETQEEKVRRLELEALANEQARLAEVVAKAAEERAEQMLFRFLNPAQRAQYKKDGFFETLINDRTYRIRKGRSMNVDLIENGKPKYKYCVLPIDSPPAPDVMRKRRTDRRF